MRDGLPTCPADAPTSLTGSCAYPQLASVDRQQIFFEPLAYRNLVDFSLQVTAPFSAYPNIVFAPHVYTYAFTIEQDLLGLPAKPGGFPPNFTFGYQTAESEAQAMHSAVFVTEFGDSSSTDPTILANELAAQEATQTGGTLWAWKGLSKAAGTCWCTRWQHSSYQTTANGTPGKGNPQVGAVAGDLLIASRQRQLMRVSPTATAGRLGAYAYDPTTPHVRHGGHLDGGGPPRRPPDRHRRLHPFDVHGAVHVSGRRGARPVVTRPDGSRLAYVTTTLPVPAGTQAYGVTVGPPSAALTSRVAAEAVAPLPPISEPVARAMAEDALTTEAHSPDASFGGQRAARAGPGRHRPGLDRPQPAPAGASAGRRRPLDEAGVEVGVEVGPTLVLEQRRLTPLAPGAGRSGAPTARPGWRSPARRCWLGRPRCRWAR